MRSLGRYRFPLFVVGLLAFSTVSQTGNGAPYYTSLKSQTFSQSLSQNGTFQWPSSSINLSQLEQILSQNPGLSQYNIQFPNQLNWNVTPGTIQNMAQTAQQEAQSMGVGKLPDLSFSSLAGGALAGGGNGLNQISIPSLLQGNGDLKGQVDNIMQQLRYGQLNLSGMLPDWLKNIIVAVYDSVYAAFDYLQTAMVSLIREFIG